MDAIFFFLLNSTESDVIVCIRTYCTAVCQSTFNNFVDIAGGCQKFAP